MFPLRLAVLLLALALPFQDPVVETSQPFDRWLEALTVEARARGFTARVIDETIAGLEPLEHVVTSDRNQAEVVMTFDRYYRNHVTAQTVRRGRQLSAEHRALLTRIERAYGVPRQVVLSIWGMESRYGRNTGRTPIFQALATLAWEPRRSDFFRGELFDAMTMVARGHIEAAAMTGSWAGAMGQTQFMPSSYLKYAVDFDADGRRDIWQSTPDALASIANYLKGYGWVEGQTWGRPVSLASARKVRSDVPPRQEGCYAVRTMTERRSLAEWRRLGLRRADGGPLPQADMDASLAWISEKPYLVYQNYEALLGYNCAHHYALSVAMLSDRLR